MKGFTPLEKTNADPTQGVRVRERSSLTGFTLVEILITLVILTVIVLGIYTVLNTAETIYTQDMGLLDLQQQGRQAIERMTRELRNATSQTISGGGGSISFNTPTATGVQYYRDTNNNWLMREFPAGTRQVLGIYITVLGFCCWHDATSTCDTTCTDSNLVEINLTASKTVRQRLLSFPLKGQVRLRNR